MCGPWSCAIERIWSQACWPGGCARFRGAEPFGLAGDWAGIGRGRCDQRCLIPYRSIVLFPSPLFCLYGAPGDLRARGIKCCGR